MLVRHKPADSVTLSYHKATRLALFPRFLELDSLLENAAEYEHFFLSDYLPGDLRKQYQFLQSLKRDGVRFPMIICTHSSRNNSGNMHFVWKVLGSLEAGEVFSKSQWVIETIRPQFPIFHTRAMHKAVLQIWYDCPYSETVNIAILLP